MKGKVPALPWNGGLILCPCVRIIFFVKTPTTDRSAGLPMRVGIICLLVIPLIATAFLGIAGCQTSGNTRIPETQTTTTPPPSRSAQAGADTLQLPPGKYTVQIGAYTSGTSAKEVADRAERRFARAVYTIYDESDSLFRVMLGVFETKNLARDFRDLIVRQFPEDYKDAWVSELTKSVKR